MKKLKKTVSINRGIKACDHGETVELYIDHGTGRERIVLYHDEIDAVAFWARARRKQRKESP